MKASLGTRIMASRTRESEMPRARSWESTICWRVVVVMSLEEYLRG